VVERVGLLARAAVARRRRGAVARRVRGRRNRPRGARRAL